MKFHFTAILFSLLFMGGIGFLVLPCLMMIGFSGRRRLPPSCLCLSWDPAVVGRAL